jgi:hypothetical protein
MDASRLTPLAAAAVVAFCAAAAPSAGAARAKRATSPQITLLRELVHSHELWATIDVCNPADQPDTVGIRGSMPPDGRARDQMYMSFRLQYEEARTGRWYDLPGNANPQFIDVGAGASVRQGGSSFQLQPKAGRPAFTLRGVVDYQWRHAGHIIQTATRATTAGHMSLAGADPAGYTAAGCLIG